MPPEPPASHTISIPVAAQPASPWRWQRKSHPHRGDRKLSSKAPSSALSHSLAPGSADTLLAAPSLPPPLAHLHPRGPEEEEDGEGAAGLDPALSSGVLLSQDPPSLLGTLLPARCGSEAVPRARMPLLQHRAQGHRHPPSTDPWGNHSHEEFNVPKAAAGSTGRLRGIFPCLGGDEPVSHGICSLSTCLAHRLGVPRCKSCPD